jgi:hypothetical protein
MGQVPFAPPNVAGWKTNGYWINTSVFGSRAEFARDTASRMRQNNNNNVGKNGNVKRTPAETVNFVASMFGFAPGQLSAGSYNALLNYVNQQRVAEPYVGWWEATNLLTMIMMIPEFHTA